MEKRFRDIKERMRKSNKSLLEVLEHQNRIRKINIQINKDHDFYRKYERLEFIVS